MTKYCQQKPLFVTNIISEVWVTKEMLVHITNTETAVGFCEIWWLVFFMNWLLCSTT